MQNNDHSWLLSFEKTKNSKLNLERIASCFEMHKDSPINNIFYIEGIEVVLVPLALADEREVRARDWERPAILSGPVSTGKVYGCFEKRNFGPDKVSR